jgi:short-subunit dehydrogenase
MSAMRRPVTLITGASAGIGAALSQVFAANGHEVALLARRGLQLTTLADTIEAAGYKRPHIFAIDLLRADATTRTSNELNDRGLEPEIVVNNAGFGLLGPAAELDRAEQLSMVDLNVRALTDLSLRFVESLARHRGGILNVASVASFLPGPGMAVYHATKAYVLSFSEALHQELAPKGVRVTALCPGPVVTEFQARAGIPESYFPSFLTRSADRVARQGYAGFMRGKRLVIPGSENKVLTFLPRLLPRALILKLVTSSQRITSKSDG